MKKQEIIIEPIRKGHEHYQITVDGVKLKMVKSIQFNASVNEEPSVTVTILGDVKIKGNVKLVENISL